MPWGRRRTDGRGLRNRGCPWCWHQPRTGAAHRGEIAVFQRSPLGASTSGSLMSALWTLGCLRGRLCGVAVAGLGSLPPEPASLFPALPLRLLRSGPRAVVQHRLRPEFRLGVGLLHEGGDPLVGGCAYCTRAPPTWSAPDPPPVAPDPRAVQARQRPSDGEQLCQPSPRRRATTIGPAAPVS